MRILSLDQSLNKCGHCLDGKVGVFYPEGKDEVEKTKSVINFIESKSPTVIVLEGLSFGSVSTSVRALAYLFYRIKEWCYDHDAEFNEISPMTLKKCAKKGNAKKWEMFQNIPEDIQKEILKATLEGQTIKKQSNMMERFKDLEKNGKYFETSTCLFDISDSYWLYRFYKKDCINEK